MSVGGGSYIRVRATDVNLDAWTMSIIIAQILRKKAESITKDKALRREIGECYVDVVSKYIPYKTGKLRDSGRATDDGRVIWSATSPIKMSRDGRLYGGYNYAKLQYDTTTFYHPIRYAGHKPTHHWTREVQPGTADWSKFLAIIAPRIIERAKKWE